MSDTNLEESEYYETIQLEFLEALPETGQVAEIARITLNRPHALNAHNTRMAEELIGVLDLLRDNERVRAVILTGAGKAFCAGADLKERNNMTDEAWMQQRRIFTAMFRGLFDFPKPLIAAINGVAFGGGTEIALNCDFIVASSEAAFALPEVSRGIMPGGGGTQLLLRLVGQNFARWMLFSGARVSASEAYRVGLAQHLIEGDRATFDSGVMALAQQIAANSPLAVHQVKQAVQQGLNLGVRAGFEAENEAYLVCVPSQDRREGMAAFNEKRPPHFIGK